MKKTENWSLKKLVTLCLLLSFTLFVSSCNDDDDFNPILVSVYTPDYWAGGTYFLYAVASDENGDVITYAPLNNGETTTLSSDTYKGKTFTLSIVGKSRGIGSSSLNGESFYELSRGGVVRLDYEDDENDGNIYRTRFNLSGFNPNTSYYYLKTDYGTTYVSSGYTSVDAYFYQNSGRIFTIAYNTDGSRKYSFPATAFNAFETYPFDLSTVTTNYSTEAVTLGANQTVYVTLNGILGSGDTKQVYSNVAESSGSGTLNLAFPGTSFPTYSSYTQIYDNDFYASIYDKDSKYNLTVPSYTYEATTTGTQLEYSLTGGGDWATVEVDYNYTAESNNSYNLDAYIPTGSNKVVNVVKLPAEITEGMDDYSYSNWEFDANQVYIADYEGFSNAKEFLLAASDKSFDSYGTNYSYVQLYLGGSGNARAKQTEVENRFKFSIMPSFKRAEDKK